MSADRTRVFTIDMTDIYSTSNRWYIKVQDARTYDTLFEGYKYYDKKFTYADIAQIIDVTI